MEWRQPFSDSTEHEQDKEKVFSTAISLLLFHLFFFWVCYYTSQEMWPDGSIMLLILNMSDGLPGSWPSIQFVLSFCLFACQKQTSTFCMDQNDNIAINIVLNLFFLVLCPFVLRHYHDSFSGHLILSFFRQHWGIEYIFYFKSCSK